MSGPQPSADLVQVALGYDRFAAQMIAEACRADGYQVELLLMDRDGVHPGILALTPHHLLVRRTDVEAVAEIIDRSVVHVDQDDGTSDDFRSRRSFGRRVVMRFVGAGLLLIIAAAVFAAYIPAIMDLL